MVDSKGRGPVKRHRSVQVFSRPHLRSVLTQFQDAHWFDMLGLFSPMLCAASKATSCVCFVILFVDDADQDEVYVSLKYGIMSKCTFSGNSTGKGWY